MKRQRIFGVVLFVLLAGPALVRADAVDDLVKAAMDKQGIPGVALAVVRDDKVVKSQGYGLANVELAVPVQPDTMYQLASVTKQFIATAMLMLVEENRVHLDDHISKYLEDTPDAWKDITIRHLLTHTSGLLNDDPFGYQVSKSLDEVLAGVRSLKLAAPTGEKYLYSNVGYNMAGLILKRQSKMPWDKFLEQRIFKPFGMTATRRFSLIDIIPHRAAGYVKARGVLKNAPALQRDLPSGGIITNVEDLAKWTIALSSGKVLKQSSLEELWRPTALKKGQANYGLGWELTQFRGRPVTEHRGSRPGYATYLGRFPEDHLNVVLLTNLSGARLPALARDIVKTLAPMDPAKPE